MYDFTVHSHDTAYQIVDDARHLIEFHPESRFAPLAELVLVRARPDCPASSSPAVRTAG